MIFYNKDKDECIVSCSCCCGDSVRLCIDDDEDDRYFYQILMDHRWSAEQNGLTQKLRKIWAIIRGKDYYYSDICMTREEFEEYKRWINSH